jgi:hypothetical protein
MAQDAADRAHQEKVEETASGERLVEHSTFTEGDRELRELADRAEAERVNAFAEGGYVAAPLAGDYHAARRAAKQSAALIEGIGGETTDDPVGVLLDGGLRKVMTDSIDQAGEARRAAGESRQGGGPRGRRTRAEAVQGGTTAGLRQGAGEGVGKSSSSFGTDATDRGMDASVGSAPANLDPGTENTAQDRPGSQEESAARRTGGGSSSGSSSGKSGGRSGGSNK